MLFNQKLAIGRFTALAFLAFALIECGVHVQSARAGSLDQTDVQETTDGGTCAGTNVTFVTKPNSRSFLERRFFSPILSWCRQTPCRQAITGKCLPALWLVCVCRRNGSPEIFGLAPVATSTASSAKIRVTNTAQQRVIVRSHLLRMSASVGGAWSIAPTMIMLIVVIYSPRTRIQPFVPRVDRVSNTADLTRG